MPVERRVEERRRAGGPTCRVRRCASLEQHSRDTHVPGDDGLGIQFAKAVEVFAIVLGPVVLGMLVRWWKPRFADAMDKPVRIASMLILAIVIAGAVVVNLDLLISNIAGLAGIVVLFCVLSLTLGFLVPRLFRVERRQAVASSFEIGIHNATLAIVIAQTVIGSVEMSRVYPPALPPSIAIFVPSTRP